MNLPPSNISRAASIKFNTEPQRPLRQRIGLLLLISLCALTLDSICVNSSFSQTRYHRKNSIKIYHSKARRFSEKAPAKLQQELFQKPDSNIVYIESWKTGFGQIKQQMISARLNTQKPEYETLVKNNLGKPTYKLSVWPGYVDGRGSGITEWTVELRGIDDRGSVNLLKPSNDPSQDYFTALDRVSWLYPLEDPKSKGVDSDVVPFLARRVIKVEGFYCTIEVKDYRPSRPSSERLDSITVEIGFTNRYPGDPKSNLVAINGSDLNYSHAKSPTSNNVRRISALTPQRFQEPQLISRSKTSGIPKEKSLERDPPLLLAAKAGDEVKVKELLLAGAKECSTRAAIPALAIDGSLRTPQASLQCVRQKVDGAPKYRVARTERTVSGAPTLIVYLSIDPRYFNRQDMTLLARQLNQDFCKEPRLSVLIFSDFRAAQSLVFSIERPPTYQRDYAALRGGYDLDRAAGQEYVSFSLDAKKPHDEIRIVLGSSQAEAKIKQ